MPGLNIHEAKELPAMRSIPVIVLFLFSATMNLPAAMAIDTSPAVGNYAPPFELKDLSGKTIRLSDYKGKLILLNFWSTQCAPCRTELPSLSRLAAVFRNADVAVLTVSIDVSDKPVRDFIEANKIVLTVLRDGDKEVFFDHYAGPMLPVSYLIDRRGIIVEIVAGPRAWDSPDTQAMILKLLKKQ
jgi:peroxiredoxin